MTTGCEKLFGQRVLIKEATELAQLKKKQALQELPTMISWGIWVKCLRCGQIHLKKRVKLPIVAYYCPSCIQLGRVTSNQVFYHLPEPHHFATSVSFAWAGQLSAQQEIVANHLCQLIKQKRSVEHLIWAVTGAGKTEILFKSIAQALLNGQRVAIASPRVDVCLELYPRLQQAFPELLIALLYGDSPSKIEYAPLTICTTHQLLHFYQAFDYLIVDEIDAFPFSRSPMLAQGVEQAKAKTAVCVYLTATPDFNLKRRLLFKQISVSCLPARYHGFALPIPVVVQVIQAELTLSRPPLFWQKLTVALSEGQPCLLFVAQIKMLGSISALIKQNFPVLKFATVFAADPERHQKVLALREGHLQLLITTTILERGVTFKGVNVLIWQADQRIFTSAALIQIAGRVGRDAQQPSGLLYFFCQEKTWPVFKAIHEIKRMNERATKRGLLKK